MCRFVTKEAGVREHPFSEDDGPQDVEYQVSETRWDTEIVSITLCKFTGIQGFVDGSCGARRAGKHPDLSCETIFVSADALSRGEIHLGAYDEVPMLVRTPVGGGEPTASVR